MSEQELSCKEVVEIVNDYLEGVMSPHDRARFDAHLSICDGCTNYLEQMRETIRLTGMLKRGSGPGRTTGAPARGVPRLEDWLSFSFPPPPTTCGAVRPRRSASTARSRWIPIPGAARGSA
jgi:anti-sigma factor RsiW